MSNVQSHENPSNAVNGNGNNKVRWKNRRRMAWTAMVAMLVVVMMLLFGPIPESRIAVVKEPLTWFFFAMASVIGAYMGFTTWASKK